MKKKILAISGSTRSRSANLSILQHITRLTVDCWEVRLYDGLTQLPYFNPDLDQQEPPAEVLAFRKAISEADGVIICTPEYVFSLPGALKNAIEWTVSTTVFSDKPTALITAAASGQKAHESLLLVMKTLGVVLGDRTDLLISSAKGKVNSEGEITDAFTLEHIRSLTRSLEAVLEKMPVKE
jgi:chromate reductase, NAD(P)H dehydrogenase (quinone)